MLVEASPLNNEMPQSATSSKIVIIYGKNQYAANRGIIVLFSFHIRYDHEAHIISNFIILRARPLLTRAYSFITAQIVRSRKGMPNISKGQSPSSDFERGIKGIVQYGTEIEIVF